MIIPACLHQAAEQWSVPQSTLKALYIKHHHHGIGPMGIPKAWVPMLQKAGLSVVRVQTDPCSNIQAAAIIIAAENAKTRKPVQPAPSCLKSAAQDYQVPYSMLNAVYQKNVGLHTDRGYGQMHIPGAWLPILRAAGFPEWRVKHDVCWNIAAASWILSADGIGRSSAHARYSINQSFSGLPNIPQNIIEYAHAAGNATGVPSSMLLAVAWQESAFDPNAVSPAGAQGLMQFMPGTWSRFGRGSPFNPQEAMMAGAKYLRLLDSEFHSWKLALAGYNAGGQAVINAGYRIPNFSQTQNYVPAVLERYGEISGK